MRLSAHTYPTTGGSAPALGNVLLAKLRVGGILVVTGAGHDRLCYRVVREVSINADESMPAYYDSSGRPRLAIAVCSGERRGPGDWSQRTIWFAVPQTAR
jgi:hypothetical protein